MFLTALVQHRPTGGAALDATARVPDLHHYQGGFGGRAWPLWLDSAGTRGNVRKPVLEVLTERLGQAVDATDVFTYVTGITGHPGFTERFLPDMTTPGLRVPVTADVGLFERLAELGRRTLWLQTFGERFTDTSAGRPAGPPRVDSSRRPRVRQGIPDGAERHPEAMTHHADEQVLAVGAGVITPVSAAAYSYGPGSMPTLARWFSKRQREPEGKGGSPLDEIVRRGWPAAWTTELLNVLNVLELLVDLDAPHRALLEEVLAGPLLEAALFGAGADTAALLPERPARQARL